MVGSKLGELYGVWAEIVGGPDPPSCPGPARPVFHTEPCTASTSLGPHSTESPTSAVGPHCSKMSLTLLSQSVSSHQVSHYVKEPLKQVSTLPPSPLSPVLSLSSLLLPSVLQGLWQGVRSAPLAAHVPCRPEHQSRRGARWHWSSARRHPNPASVPITTITSTSLANPSTTLLRYKVQKYSP